MPNPSTPAIATDCVVIDHDKRILFVRRKNSPFEGMLALPGGFLNVGETVEDGCRREVREETAVELGELTLVGVYSDPVRDPRHHTVSIAFLASVERRNATAGDDAEDAIWMSGVDPTDLAFDHGQIVADGLWLLAAVKLPSVG